MGQPILVQETQNWLDQFVYQMPSIIVNISANPSYTKLWIIIEAESESQLISVIEKLPIIDLYHYEYEGLSITTSAMNFSGTSWPPEQ
jgi:hypothetical protein